MKKIIYRKEAVDGLFYIFKVFWHGIMVLIKNCFI